MIIQCVVICNREIIVQETIGGLRIDDKIRESCIRDGILIDNLELIVEKSVTIELRNNLGPIRIVDVKISSEAVGSTSWEGHRQVIGSITPSAHSSDST